MRTPAHHLSKRFGCATARFHLAGRGELVGVILGKYEIRAADSRPAARGSRRLAHGCVCLLRSGGWDFGPGLPCGFALLGVGPGGRALRSTRPAGERPSSRAPWGFREGVNG